jgi:hypothetical protein
VEGGWLIDRALCRSKHMKKDAVAAGVFVAAACLTIYAARRFAAVKASMLPTAEEQAWLKCVRRSRFARPADGCTWAALRALADRRRDRARMQRANGDAKNTEEWPYR